MRNAPVLRRVNKLAGIHLDLAHLSRNIEAVVGNAQVRKAPVKPDRIRELPLLFQQSRQLQSQLESCRARLNAVVKSKQADAGLKAEVLELEVAAAQTNTQLQEIAADLPNSTHDQAPTGGYAACRVVRSFGPSVKEAKPLTNKDHLAICTQLDWLDMTAGAQVTGSRWPVLRNEAVLLELALISYALSRASQAGYTPTILPDVVKADIADRCGFQPRAENASQTFRVYTASEQDSLVLAGTAEIPLAGQYSGAKFDHHQLPLKSAACGHAFRAEAGARGKESKGLYRVHQFSKVELFVVCLPEDSDEMLESLVALQEDILGGLGLPCRVLEMSTEELGASAYRKYDIEAWMPGRGSWGELASASNCTDYQARRLDIRYKIPVPAIANRPSDKSIEVQDIPIPAHLEATAVLDYTNEQKPPKMQFAHTLNATAAAIPRLILALVENGARYEQSTGQLYIELPRALKQFWIGLNDSTGVKNAAGTQIIRWSG